MRSVVVTSVPLRYLAVASSIDTGTARTTGRLDPVGGESARRTCTDAATDHSPAPGPSVQRSCDAAHGSVARERTERETTSPFLMSRTTTATLRAR
jgi:hypothetical protein